jgi:methylenetetrahydrofolate reductase (NADPH)
MAAETKTPIANLLETYSVEVVPRDAKGVETACELLRPGAEVFVASLPNEPLDTTVGACVRLARAGLTPVPHVAARNIRSRAELEDMLTRAAGEAGCDHALVLGGDRDEAVGPYSEALQLIETGLFEQRGYRRVAFAVHPEGHPRVADSQLWPALPKKLAAAKARGLEPYLVGQFAFDADPIVSLARRLREAGIDAPYRVGIAGPAKRTTLIKYALMCGVGPSLRALRERQELAANVMAGETPEALLREVAAAAEAEPALGIEGVHFFTFGSLKSSIEFAEDLRR